MKRTRTKKTPLKFFTFTVLGNFLLNFQHYIKKKYFENRVSYQIWSNGLVVKALDLSSRGP